MDIDAVPFCMIEKALKMSATIIEDYRAGSIDYFYSLAANTVRGNSLEQMPKSDGGVLFCFSPGSFTSQGAEFSLSSSIFPNQIS